MAEVLRQLSTALAEVVQAAGQSVVRVEARRRLPASGIVWSADGVLVTAHHVVERDENIVIGLPNGETAAATLVGRDPTTDVAVLRTSAATGLTPPAWTEPASLRVGHLVLAVGRARQSVQSTLGIVSAQGTGWRTPGGGNLEHYLQTDVVMYPGFSGGPLVDMEGHVLGVNTSALLPGISLTVTVPTLRRVVAILLAHGRVRRGYLGVGAQVVRLPAALAQQIGQETGLLLVSVEPGSPAEQGRLLLGDTIVTLAGQPMRRLEDLVAALSGDRIGSAVPLRLIRGGQVLEQSVTVGEAA